MEGIHGKPCLVFTHPKFSGSFLFTQCLLTQKTHNGMLLLTTVVTNFDEYM